MRSTRAKRSGWATFGIVVAVALAVAGLALVALTVLFVVGMSNYGSNK